VRRPSDHGTTIPNGHRSAFKAIEEMSQKMLTKSAIARFADKGEDFKVVVGLVERLREAIICYQVGEQLPLTLGIVDRLEEQVSQQQAIYHQITHLAVRLS
jgi:hypothetical protein